ncbi:MAG: GspE/PulE family protein, partial [Candidatus Saccharimonadales bacterium]
ALVLPIETADGIIARIKVLSNLKLDEHRLPQDGRFKIESDEYRYALRVSVLPVFGGEKIVMRLLAEDSGHVTLEQLGFVKETAKLIMDNLAKPVGMILVTGPTGSGKTTSLYSMMEILNTPTVNISTIEDPIEYRMPRINQTQVNPVIGLTFAAGLRALVRQDPNVIMVGEIRDRITARLAINAALTGHLVLSTLHTNSAAGAIPRLIDMGVEPFLISSTVNIIIAQRLVRKFHGEKEAYRLESEELEHLKAYSDISRIEQMLKAEKLLKSKETISDVTLYRPKKSAEAPSGYRGRVGIVEAMNITPAIRELAGKKASIEAIAAQARKEGTRAMFEDGFLKAAQGVTSLEEVLRVT